MTKPFDEWTQEDWKRLWFAANHIWTSRIGLLRHLRDDDLEAAWRELPKALYGEEE